MQISKMNWFQVEERAKADDRAVLPLGSTEQHAYLSLSVDSILAERVAVDAVADSGIPVFPTVPYGLAPYFRDYPGTVTLTPNTYNSLVGEILDGIHASGLRRPGVRLFLRGLVIGKSPFGNARRAGTKKGGPPGPPFSNRTIAMFFICT